MDTIGSVDTTNGEGRNKNENVKEKTRITKKTKKNNIVKKTTKKKGNPKT